jgi:hypothetical protein
MTLQQVIRTVEVIASKQPAVNMIVRNDIFRLNEAPDARYGVFAWLQGQHTGAVDESLVRYSFTFFYADRLTADLGNQVEVQSTGMEVLTNILRVLDQRGISVADRYSFRTFNERFHDECAGVFCDVTLEVPAGSLCPEGFGDFNDDFNDDFMIW